MNQQQPVTSATQPSSSPPTSASEPNLVGAIAGGLAAALVGAMLWAAITITVKAQIGFMALGVGILVAWTVRALGKGATQSFGVIGAVFALLGCVVGNLLSVCGLVSQQQGVAFMSIAPHILLSPSAAVELMEATFNPMDLLFYGIAIYEGYRLARRPLIST